MSQKHNIIYWYDDRAVYDCDQCAEACTLCKEDEVRELKAKS